MCLFDRLLACVSAHLFVSVFERFFVYFFVCVCECLFGSSVVSCVIASSFVRLRVRLFFFYLRVVLIARLFMSSFAHVFDFVFRVINCLF